MTLRVGNVDIDNFRIKEKLKLINKDNLIQLVSITKENGGIKNMNKYLTSCLYNNLGNANINKQAPVKKSLTNRIEGREYSDEYLESFYMQ